MSTLNSIDDKPSHGSSDRKSSSVGLDEKQAVDGDDDAGVDLRYGCFGCRPPRLQWLNTIGGFVAWVSLANCFHNMVNALIGVVLSTLEKRFGFSSSSSSWIASAYEIGAIPVLIVVSYFGNRIHRPVSCSVGMLLVGLSCILYFLPQFTTPVYRPSEGGDGDDSNLCMIGGSNRTSGCSTAPQSLSGYLPLFIIAALVEGVASTPIYTLGVTYMDDCADRGRFATFSGIFNAMSIVGPAIAFVGGGFMLNIFVDFYALSPDEIEITSADSRWIGAWWLPYTIAAALCLLSAIPIWGYPEDMPGASKIREGKVTEAHVSAAGAAANERNKAEIAYIKTWSEFSELFKSVMTNPTYICLTLFACCDNFIVAGFTAFGPKVFEVSFSYTAAFAGVLFGVVMLPAGVGGTIIGGVLIEKLNLTCSQIIRIQTVLTAIVTAALLLLLLTCSPLNFAGVNTTYNTSISSSSSSSSSSNLLNLTNVCNIGCDCDQVAYSPICSHDNIMYYSPCHAGCSRMENEGDRKSYYNCSCIANPTDFRQAEATSDACSADFCPVSIFFMIGFFFVVASIFICFTANLAATLRCVSSSQTSFALGTRCLFVKIIGTIVGPVLMGVSFDKSCVSWQYDECGEGGSCLFYDNNVLAIELFIVCFTVKVISLVATVLAAILYKPPRTAEPLVQDVPAPDKLEDGTANGNDKVPLTAAVVLTAGETNAAFEEHSSIHL